MSFFSGLFNLFFSCTSGGQRDSRLTRKSQVVVENGEGEIRQSSTRGFSLARLFKQHNIKGLKVYKNGQMPEAEEKQMQMRYYTEEEVPEIQHVEVNANPPPVPPRKKKQEMKSEKGTRGGFFVSMTRSFQRTGNVKAKAAMFQKGPAKTNSAPPKSTEKVVTRPQTAMKSYLAELNETAAPSTFQAPPSRPMATDEYHSPTPFRAPMPPSRNFKPSPFMETPMIEERQLSSPFTAPPSPFMRPPIPSTISQAKPPMSPPPPMKLITKTVDENGTQESGTSKIAALRAKFERNTGTTISGGSTLRKKSSNFSYGEQRDTRLY